jgi:hypothetical protein
MTEPTKPDGEQPHVPSCPNCRSTNLYRYANTQPSAYRCRRCHNQWTEEDHVTQQPGDWPLEVHQAIKAAQLGESHGTVVFPGHLRHPDHPSSWTRG